MTDTYTVTTEELRQFIERAEQLASEKRDVAEQEKELFAEAKGRGYAIKPSIRSRPNRAETAKDRKETPCAYPQYQREETPS